MQYSVEITLLTPLIVALAVHRLPEPQRHLAMAMRDALANAGDRGSDGVL